MAEPEDTVAVDAPTPVRPRTPDKSASGRWTRMPLALAVVWVALAIADIVIIDPFGAASRHSGARAAEPGGVAAHRHSAPGGRSHVTTGQRRPSASWSPAPRVLVPVSASAFGPSGYGSGDNPQGAALAIDGNAATAWRTSWYRSAGFGNLQAGTGLLIDMGHPVRITRVQLVLDAAHGANLELLTGRLPVMAEERVQAQVADAGGTLELRLARPQRARYLLVWFTLLPPDSAGTFEEAIYSVRLRGTP